MTQSLPSAAPTSAAPPPGPALAQPEPPRRSRRPLIIFLVWLLAVPLTILVDEPLRAAYHAWAGHTDALDNAADWLSYVSSVWRAGPIILLLILLDRRTHWRLLGDAAMVAGTDGFAELMLKNLFGRLRPDNVAALGESIFRGPSWASGFGFPSGHAMWVFALGALFCTWYPRWRWVIIALAVIVALARVQLDRHFFGDIVAGAFFGWYGASALVGWRRRWTQRRRQARAEALSPDEAEAAAG